MGPRAAATRGRSAASIAAMTAAECDSRRPSHLCDLAGVTCGPDGSTAARPISSGRLAIAQCTGHEWKTMSETTATTSGFTQRRF